MLKKFGEFENWTNRVQDELGPDEFVELLEMIASTSTMQADAIKRIQDQNRLDEYNKEVK